MVDRDAFWLGLDSPRWVYPYDANLKNDSFRSLAGELRRAGGFANDTTPPFSEFLWADFLRRRLSCKNVEADIAKAIERALDLARSHEAIYLPGWCGPSSSD